MADAILTAERLRSLVDYNPETGEFIRKVTVSGPARAGSVARGCIARNGYRYIGFDGGVYLAHRCAWLHVHGEWPDGMIDHVNGVRTDNRLANLRVVDHVLNGQNQRTCKRTSTTSSLLGVSRMCGGKDRFRARIYVGKKEVFLGVFDTEHEAHRAYIEAKRRLHPGCAI